MITFYDYAVERVVGRWSQALPKLSTGWTQTELAGWPCCDRMATCACARPRRS
ncbi:hypothetical protein [Rhodanobacter lindaniclasticus]